MSSLHYEDVFFLLTLLELNGGSRFVSRIEEDAVDTFDFVGDTVSNLSDKAHWDIANFSGAEVNRIDGS